MNLVILLAGEVGTAHQVDEKNSFLGLLSHVSIHSQVTMLSLSCLYLAISQLDHVLTVRSSKFAVRLNARGDGPVRVAPSPPPHCSTVGAHHDRPCGARAHCILTCFKLSINQPTKHLPTYRILQMNINTRQ